MNTGRTISTISLQVALAIGGSRAFNDIERFSLEANENEYTCFTHFNFFYSYPEWGKKWPDGKSCQYHRVNTKCHLCDYMPERNFAGVGHIYILNNGICNDDILVSGGYRIERGRRVQILDRVQNTARLSRMILLCPDHVRGYFKWDPNRTESRGRSVQLELF